MNYKDCAATSISSEFMHLTMFFLKVVVHIYSPVNVNKRCKLFADEKLSAKRLEYANFNLVPDYVILDRFCAVVGIEGIIVLQIET